MRPGGTRCAIFFIARSDRRVCYASVADFAASFARCCLHDGIEDALCVAGVELLTEQGAQHLRSYQLVDKEIGVDAVRQFAGVHSVFDDGASFRATRKKEL